MVPDLEAIYRRLRDSWHSSKTFGGLVMFAIVAEAVYVSALAFRVLLALLCFALFTELVLAVSLSDDRQTKRWPLWLVTGLMLLGGMAALAAIRMSELGVLTLVLLAVSTFLNDVGAQAIGKLCAARLRPFGQRQLPKEPDDSSDIIEDATRLLLRVTRWCARGLAAQPFRTASPNKTWVGLVAGLIIGWAAGAGCLWWFHAAWGYPLSYGIALVALTPPLAVCGDVAESATKRSLDIKDMSSVLGAHGGFADRLDAISATALGAVTLMILGV